MCRVTVAIHVWLTDPTQLPAPLRPLAGHDRVAREREALRVPFPRLFGGLKGFARAAEYVADLFHAAAVVDCPKDVAWEALQRRVAYRWLLSRVYGVHL